MEDLEYYVALASKYKQACGILRTRFSQTMEILADPNMSNDEKVNILSGEMRVLSNDDAVSYESLDIYDDYSFLIDHSEEYESYFESKKM